MNNLRQYWRGAAASINKFLGLQPNPRQRQETLERELLALTSEYQALAGKLELMRAESERRALLTLQKVEGLEESRREAGTARMADAARLAELEQRLVATEQARETGHSQVMALEASLRETTHRLETRGNQLKFLQDSAREQLQVLKTALAEAASRLETRDDALEARQDAAHEQIDALGTSLARTVSRFESTDSAVEALRAAREEQARTLETYLASTTVQLEAASQQVMALEKKLDAEHRLQHKLFEDAQAQLHRQDKRLRHIMLVAVFALVLAAAAGAIIFRGVG
ncbi:MAG: hypothetical protein WBO37_15910 [Gammaproteobacteria bacterium]